MSRLFIFTAADKNARKHLNDSIENPIDHSIIKSHFLRGGSPTYEKLLPNVFF